MPLPSSVTLVEVGPRDGLQNEPQLIPTEDKIAFIECLQQAGLRAIEVTSFVSPKWVPQMADNAQVLAGLQRLPQVRYAALVPNLQGLQQALQSQLDDIVIFPAASETFSQRNLNASIEQTLVRFQAVIAAAQAHSIPVRAVISCAFGCPYEGPISPDQVISLIRRLQAIGVNSIGLADTMGIATAGSVQQLMKAALQYVPLAHLSGHFHDTYGQALTNIYACLELGLHTFDTSISGLGGCPYAPGATGNVATEDVAYLLHGLQIETGLNLDLLVAAGAFISQILNRQPTSRVHQALLARKRNAK